MRSVKFQFFLISMIIILNCLFYIAVPFDMESKSASFSLSHTNATITIWYCSIRNLQLYKEMSVFYLIESCFVPFVIMLTTTLLTIQTLYSSRNRIETFESRELKARRSKDIKFAINSIVLDLIYLSFQMPICINYILFIGDAKIRLMYSFIAGFLYFTNFSIAFFTHFISNSIFRAELFKLFGL